MCVCVCAPSQDLLHLLDLRASAKANVLGASLQEAHHSGASLQKRKAGKKDDDDDDGGGVRGSGLHYPLEAGTAGVTDGE